MRRGPRSVLVDDHLKPHIAALSVPCGALILMNIRTLRCESASGAGPHGLFVRPFPRITQQILWVIARGIKGRPQYGLYGAQDEKIQPYGARARSLSLRTPDQVRLHEYRPDLSLFYGTRPKRGCDLDRGCSLEEKRKDISAQRNSVKAGSLNLFR